MAKILIVEDNPDNMKLFTAVLSIRGHRVVGLPGGEQLLPTMRAEAPQVVLLDIQLPGEDGFQLLERLVADLGPALPPVVALTAHAMSGDREKALRAGFSGYLTKPIDVSTFASSVEAFLSHAG
ncbi:MAG TPA: response regulator [Gemmatimonadales bacterium]|nr:response regulator [Gemmatimonadales bacterium]